MTYRPKIPLPANSVTLPVDTLPCLLTSLKRQWKRYRRGLKRCQRRFTTKAVHESRVETRRLLSMLELLGPFLVPGRVKKGCAALKQHLDLFDDLRDTQVQLSAIDSTGPSSPAAAQFQRYLRKREERFTGRSRKNVRRIKTRRLSELVSCCRRDARDRTKHLPPDRINALLLQTVDKAFGRTLQFKAHIDPRRTETIHRTRVAFKRFRYMIETLAEQLPLVTQGVLEAMHDYQTLMGEIQDAEVMLQGFVKFAKKKKLEGDEALAFRQELLGRRQNLLARYLRKSNRLLEFWPRPAVWAGGPPGNGAPAAPSASISKPHRGGRPAPAPVRKKSAPHL